MGIKEQMIGILRSSDAQRIKFSFAGKSGNNISIDGSGFTRVAQAISDNVVHIVEGNARDGQARYSAFDDTSQSVAANTFYIGKNNRSSRIFDGLIVHEAVHAIFDLTRTTIPWIDNETAAFIAQGYYLRNSGYPRKQLNTTDMPYFGLMIVESIIGDNNTDLEFWTKAMHGTLESDESYHDYIRGDFTGNG